MEPQNALSCCQLAESLRVFVLVQLQFKLLFFVKTFFNIILLFKNPISMCLLGNLYLHSSQVLDVRLLTSSSIGIDLFLIFSKFILKMGRSRKITQPNINKNWISISKQNVKRLHRERRFGTRHVKNKN